MGKNKFAMIGNGFLASTIADAYCRGAMPEYELTAVFGIGDEEFTCFRIDCYSIRYLDRFFRTICNKIAGISFLCFCIIDGVRDCPTVGVITPFCTVYIQ